MASKKRKLGVWVGAAAAGLAVGIAIERAVVSRARSRPDPEASEPLGSLRGTSIGPMTSFDGTKINVEEAGRGPTVIFSHGYSFDVRSWHYQIRDLAPKIRLVLYDHRGHGRSERAAHGDWSLDALAKDLAAVIEHSKAGRVALVGHSMGGMAVLKLCELYPDLVRERVAGLVLVDTTAADLAPEMIPYMPRRLRAAAQGLQEAMTRAVVSLDRTSMDRLRRRSTDIAWLVVRLMGFGPGASPAHVAFAERMLSETPTDTWIDLLPAISGIDVTHVLPTIDVPTMVVVGTADRLTPPGAAERIAHGIRGAKLGRIAGSGHSPMIESWQTFNARLMLFLRDLEWGTRSAGDEAEPTLEGPAAAS